MDEQGGADPTVWGLEWGRLSPSAIDAMDPGTLAVLPIGAVEQHGPHLPLDTDLRIVEAVTDAVIAAGAGDSRARWLRLPTLAWSRSSEHTWAAGTLVMSARTMMAVLDDLGASLARTPVRRLVFLNAHGGNTSLLGVICRELRLHYGLSTFLTHPMMPADHGGVPLAPHEHGLGIHAGHEETSLLLHLAPDLVDMSRARANLPASLIEPGRVGFGRPVSFGWLSDDWPAEDGNASGVIGDPTRATAQEGGRILAAVVGQVRDSLSDISRFPLQPR